MREVLLTYNDYPQEDEEYVDLNKQFRIFNDVIHEMVILQLETFNNIFKSFNIEDKSLVQDIKKILFDIAGCL